MDIAVAQQLSSELKIGAEQVVREYWEMTLLNELSKEDWSAGLGFKGGTALRLSYGSPRFSDDLDFVLLGRHKGVKLFRWAEVVASKFALEITDSAEKRNTFLVEFRIRDAALERPVKQKIEISRRETKTGTEDYQLKLISSPTTNSQAILRVISLELMWEEKISALKSRKEPRDLFDLWYIGQKLMRPLPPDLPKIPAKMLKVTLNRYLPLDYRKVVSALEAL